MPATPSRLLVIAAVLLGGLAGCATPPPASDPDAVADYKETNDPLEPTNRAIYAFNNAHRYRDPEAGGPGLSLRGAGICSRWHSQRLGQPWLTGAVQQ